MSVTTTLGASGQGGYLLPAGYLSTSGNQIVDSSGNPVRIDSIGWNGTDGAAGGALQGLSATSFQTIMNAIKADGFNTIRIPWSDVGLTSTPASGQIDYSQNPSLKGLDTLQIFQQIVAYAGQIGLKVIFDHHTNDGGLNGWGGQQVNGLWFDSGPGSDGTDGSGTTGTVTAAKFQQDWVTLASTFKGNSTVIGYDLDNEPTSAGNINWGQGGPTDIAAMYKTVGNAVEAADPGALIIAEGPQEYSAPGAGSGMSANVAAPEGDLTGVATDPVVLNTPNKIVYSVHEYPSTISGTSVDSGSAYIQQMNAAWGYLESQNIAPVWVGEMGASLDGTADSSGSGLANEQAWAATLLGYMNGLDGAQGGPTFSGNKQPIGGSWWLAGTEAGQYPDGIQTAYGVGNYRAAQQAVTNQMLFIPKGTPTPTPSGNDTVVKGTTGAITDASGNKWTITAAGQVAVNGVADTTTGNVTELAYVNGTIWQENKSGLWWGETKPNASWAPTAGTATSPLPPTQSPNDTVLKPNTGGAIVDASGNKWTITGTGQVAVNGVVDTTTARVTELAWVNNKIWQENASNLWWGKTSSTAAWSPNAGTATSPLSTTVTISLLETSATVSLSQTSVVATSGNHMVFITGSGNTVNLSGGTDTITDTGLNNTYVIPAAGQGYDIFTSNMLTAGHTLDFRAALAATNWNGLKSTVGKYLTIADTAQGAVVSVTPTSGGKGVAVATIDGATTGNLNSLLLHSVI
jgi:endoglucanase